VVFGRPRPSAVGWTLTIHGLPVRGIRTTRALAAVGWTLIIHGLPSVVFRGDGRNSDSKFEIQNLKGGMGGAVYECLHSLALLHFLHRQVDATGSTPRSTRASATSAHELAKRRRNELKFLFGVTVS
jgi:hypothetical protein